MSTPTILTITNLDEAKEIYRSKEMAQALYDDGEIMNGVLVNLHADEHRSRRRLEKSRRCRFPRPHPLAQSGRGKIPVLRHQPCRHLWHVGWRAKLARGFALPS